MDVFDLHEQLISDYGAYTQSFIRIADERIRKAVNAEVAAGLLWPDPLLQLNPNFESGATISELVDRTRSVYRIRHVSRCVDGRRRFQATLARRGPQGVRLHGGLAG